MTGRERFLTAISNGKPDRLPCQVHSWMQYYLDTYLHGMDQYQAYEYFDMDPVIYVSPRFIYASCPNGGYICSPSDHFFFGDPENIKAFVEAARECTY